MENNFKTSSFYSNKVFNWMSSDSEENFLKNVQERKQELIDNNWYPNKEITYAFNSSGFRGEDFTTDPSIMFLGCSNTFGVGLNLEDTFSSIVAKKLNLKNINLGLPGGGSDTCFRLANEWIPKLKPKIVVFLPFSQERFEINIGEGSVNLLPKWVGIKDLETFYFKYWLQNQKNSYLNLLKNRLATEYICKIYNIKFFHSTIVGFFKRNDLARDLIHYGIRSHLAFSEKLLLSIDTL